MRIMAIATIYIFLAESIQAAELKKSLAKEEFNKRAAGMAIGSAALGQTVNRPHEWGRGTSGFAKRAGSAFGKHLVKTGVQVGVATWRHEDLKYYPSEKPGFGPRMQHALVSVVVARKTTTGKPTAATGRVSGSLAGGFVSRLWQPARLHTVSSGFASSGISLGVDAGSNVVREFWPEIRHPREAAAGLRAR